ncbi:MAG TPA: transglutaminase family protein [Luteimonas sp.]|nr:transglutaminase family protein [Luteimonas sp.]
MKFLLTTAVLAIAVITTGPVFAGPTENSEDPGVALVRKLLSIPEGEIDFAQAKIAIDHLIDPSIDSAATLRQIDTWAAKVEVRFPSGATQRRKLDLLISTLYEPGPWNDFRPFSYDLDDPLGQKMSNKLVSNYLASRKGQCVSMPILFAILGQKLGLPVTLATAPSHILVKYADVESGQWLNIEATAGGFKHDSSYERETHISPLAIKNRIYLRPLSKRESVAVMAITLMEFNSEQGRPMPNFKIADLLLDVDPKNVAAMVVKSAAFYQVLDQRYKHRYPRVEQIPSAQMADFVLLNQQHQSWGQGAEALGWTPESSAQKTEYLNKMQTLRAQK